MTKVIRKKETSLNIKVNIVKRRFFKEFYKEHVIQTTLVSCPPKLPLLTFTRDLEHNN